MKEKEINSISSWDCYTYFLFFGIFLSLGVYLRLKMSEAVVINWINDYQLKHLTDMSAAEIFFSEYHSYIMPYRIIFSNLLFSHFGINEITIKAFSIVASIFTLWCIHSYALRYLNKHISLFSLFLFGICYYSLWTCSEPWYGSFYMFSSFASLYFMTRAMETNRLIYWWGFAGICFLLFTNLITALSYAPFLLMTGLIQLYFIYKQKTTPFALTLLKKFSVSFFCSIMVTIIYYQVRGLNIIQTAFDILLTQTAAQPELRVVAFHDYQYVDFGDRLDHFARFLHGIFFTFNFQRLGWEQGVPGSYPGSYFPFWLYFSLFLLGLIYLLRRNKNIFWQFLSVFLVAPIVFFFVLNIREIRYMAFILPIYLITVAAGVLQLGLFFKGWFRNENQFNLVFFSAVFLVFSLVVHPKPIWNQSFLARTFHLEGLGSAKSYVDQNIKKNDVVLNATLESELITSDRNGNALGIHSSAYYFRPYLSNHSLDSLPDRKGRVGLWLILQQPLDFKKSIPFYFPNGYSPRLIKSFVGAYVYHGSLDLPDPLDIKNDNTFITPFWSYLKGLALFHNGEYELSKYYFQIALKYGINLERVYYNLGTIFMRSNIPIALEYYQRAIDVVEVGLKNERSRTLGEEQVFSMTIFGKEKSGLPNRNQSETRAMHFFFEDRNGKMIKKMSMRDWMIFRKQEYSFYYFSIARALYILAYESHQDQLLKPIKYFFNKSLSIYPENQKKQGIVKIFNSNLQVPPSLKFKTFEILNLLGAREIYPPF